MRVLVGITGGIAAYKSAEVIRLFVEAGHEVRVVPTPNALRFIGAATLEALSHNPVHSEIYDDVNEVRHIELAQWAQLIVVAPATASFLARTAVGLADDLLGNVLMAAACPKVIAPAMHTEMWQNDATRENVATLTARGIHIVEPASGRLTGTDTGVGRLPEPRAIFEIACSALQSQDLVGKRVLVITGGTREPFDAVRFIGNKSSGKQGLALAKVARDRGANVTLVTANVPEEIFGIQRFEVETVAELEGVLIEIGNDFDYTVMPAAISDYRVATSSDSKLKKSSLGEKFTLELVQNPDLISGRVAKKIPGAKIVGFAAETVGGSELRELATEKLRRKGLDMIVANDVSGGKAFDQDTNEVQIIDNESFVNVSGSKEAIANRIFDLLLTAK